MRRSEKEGNSNIHGGIHTKVLCVSYLYVRRIVRANLCSCICPSKADGASIKGFGTSPNKQHHDGWRPLSRSNAMDDDDTNEACSSAHKKISIPFEFEPKIESYHHDVSTCFPRLPSPCCWQLQCLHDVARPTRDKNGKILLLPG